MMQKRLGAMLVGLMVLSAPMVGAQTMGAAAKKPTTLGSTAIGRGVMADGKPLAAGTYTLRLSDEMPAAVVGQAADESRWVEFVQGGTVKGREIATVLSKEALKQLTKGGTPPAAGAIKVERLKGDDYVRVWVNHAGVQYLIHLSAAK